MSLAGDGSESNNFSGRAALSADGRWVAFTSAATNLVPADTNGQWDVFLRDRESGTTTRVSVGPGGAQLTVPSDVPAIDAAGRVVAFQAGSPLGLTQILVYDRSSGETAPVSVGAGGVNGNAPSAHPAVSADGRWVAFTSRASNLVPGDTNAADDVFVYDRQSAALSRVSLGADGAQANSYSAGAVSISADGRWIAFTSAASNLVASDANRHDDVFIHDRTTGETIRISVGEDDAEANGDCHGVSVSADGRWVAFASAATNLADGDTNGHEDVFVHDRVTGLTSRTSLGAGGIQPNAGSFAPSLSADGRFVTFFSAASNLVPGDTNGREDVFVHDRFTAQITRVSLGPGGAEANRASVAPSISVGGRFVAFESDATNLVAGDSNDEFDVFIRDRGETGCTVALAPPFDFAPATAASGRVVVVASWTCGWTAASNDPWLTVTGGAQGTGVGVVEYAVAPNPAGYRSGSLSIDGQLLALDQRDEATPAAPTQLRVHSVTDRLVTLRWTMPAGGPAPTGFVIEGGLFPNDVQATIPTGSTASAFTFNAPAGSFYVRVQALNGMARSSNSNEILLHVDAPVPPSPPAHLLGTVNGSTVSLAWTNTYQGGAPASLWLEVSGTGVATIPLGLTDHVSFESVPRGTYTVALRAANAAGVSERSAALTLMVPVACTGPPATPVGLTVTRVGRTVRAEWSPGPLGGAPRVYAIGVTGAFDGHFATPETTLSGTVAAGAYGVTVTAINDCGASLPTPPVTFVVP